MKIANYNTIDKFFKDHVGYPVRFTQNKDGSISLDVSVIMKNTISKIQINKLPFSAETAKDAFDCHGLGLKTLKGCPKYVGGFFSCNNNKLTTLEDGPIEIGDAYYCSNNNIQNFKGISEQIKGSIFASNNKNLYDIIYFPEGCTCLYIDNTPIKEIFDMFCHSIAIGDRITRFDITGDVVMKDKHSTLNPKNLIRYLNDYEPIRGNTISTYRFKQMIEEICPWIQQREIEKNFKFKNYNVVA